MIQDSLTQAPRYAGLHPLFPTAFAWLAAHPTIADGRHAIRGEDLFVIAETGPTFDAAVRRFESHRTYIDIQVNLAGGEIMEWLPVAGLTTADDFQPDGDIAFYAPPVGAPSRLHVMPGQFTVFWPADAHKPVCHPPSGPTTYRKLVFKVRLAATG
jgi:biofilm protein TabA